MSIRGHIDVKMQTPETTRHHVPSARIDKPVVEFLSFLGIGTVVFWATDSLAAGAVMPSIRAGWRSFRTGLWILRSDRRRSRSLVCSAFCFATGFWKGAAAALASIGVFVAEYHMTGKETNAAEGIVTVQRMFFGILLAAIFGLLATIAAAAVRVRVWIHPMLREWVRGDFALLANLAADNGMNHAVFVLATSLTCPTLIPMYFLLIHPPSELVLPAVTLGGAFLVLVGYGWFASRMIATDPHQCWANRDREW